MAGILTGLLYTAGPLKWITDLLAGMIGIAGGLPLFSEILKFVGAARQARSSYEPSAPPFEEADEYGRDDAPYPDSFNGRGATTGRRGYE